MESWKTDKLFIYALKHSCIDFSLLQIIKNDVVYDVTSLFGLQSQSSTIFKVI